jgi:hypothetical protein
MAQVHHRLPIKEQARDESGNRAARSREAAGRNLPQSSVSRNNFELKKTVKFSLAAA